MDYRGIFFGECILQLNAGKMSVLLSWQVCLEVQILSLEIDGSARDRLAFDQSAAADISTYAGWIIKNTSDPLWRNKLLLLLHPHMQYVSSRGKVELILYSLESERQPVTPNWCAMEGWALLYVCTDVLVFIYWVQGSVSAEIISVSQDDQTHLT